MRLDEIEDEPNELTKELLRKNFHIDGTFNINSNNEVNISGGCELVEDTEITKLPIKFNTVSAYFSVAKSKIESLEGCPSTVRGNFLCFETNIENLIGGPEEVGGYYDCRNTLITSLDGIPKKIIGQLILPYHTHLPLLKIMSINMVKNVRLIGSKHAVYVSDIVNKYLHQGRAGALQCAAELIKAGYKDNAKL